MHYLRRIVAWFASLESVEPFQKWIPIFLKILGVVAYVFAFVWSIVLFVGVFLGRDNIEISSLVLHLIGSSLMALFNVLIGTVLIMLFWNRSNKISTLHNESDFTLLQIAVILIRLSGEAAFIVLITTGIHGLMAGIFGIGIPGVINFLYIPSDVDMSIAVDLAFGVISIIASTIYGIIALISSYIFAALLNLVVGMAKDLRKIDTTLSTDEISSES